MLNLLVELVRKDLRIFVADRRSVVISFAIPTVLACFIGFLMSQTSSGEARSVPVVIVDQDHSEFSKALLAKLGKSDSVQVTESDETTGAGKVKHGDVSLAVVIPKGFGAAA